MPLSNEIVSIINPFTWGGLDEEHRPFVSLFCGGCAIEAKVKADIKEDRHYFYKACPEKEFWWYFREKYWKIRCGYNLVFPKLWRVRAVWDGLNEEFYEKITKQYIRDEDIITWWEDNKNE